MPGEKVKKDEIDRIAFDQFEQFIPLNEEDLEEMHCNSKRDDNDLEEMHCNSKRDDENKMEEESTDKYDDDEALKGKQKSELPDGLQKAIINSMGEGHDGATKGHSQMSKATKKREKRPFDYEKGKIADEVFEEETISGAEEAAQNYDEPMEELVVPGVMPKGAGDVKTGIKPHIVKILKQREKSAHLGPVPDDLEPEKNES